MGALNAEGQAHYTRDTGIRMMEFRIEGRVKRTSESIIYGRGTRPQHATVCLGCGRKCQSPISRSPCLVNVTCVSALLAYYFTGVTKYVCCRRNKDNKMSQRQPDKRNRISPTNLQVCCGCHTHLGYLPPRDLRGSQDSFRKCVSVRMLLAASDRKPNSLSGLNKEAGWFQI